MNVTVVLPVAGSATALPTISDPFLIGNSDLTGQFNSFGKSRTSVSPALIA